MNDIDSTVVTLVTHGHFDTLLKLGFLPEYIEDNDARAVWRVAAEMVHRTPAVKPNRLNILSATTGELQDYATVKTLLSMNGTGEAAPELVVNNSHKRHLLKQTAQVIEKFSNLKHSRPGDVKDWLPLLAQELESVATKGYAYNPNPEAHRGSIVAPVMFKSKLALYNTMFEGGAEDGGGYRAGWWCVWLGITGRGKTTHSYTMAVDAIKQGKKVIFISKENQSHIRARILLGLTGLGRKEVESGIAEEQEPMRDAAGQIAQFEGIGPAHLSSSRQQILDEWTSEIQDYQRLRLYDWSFAKSGHIKSIIATEQPDLMNLDYFDQNDVPGNDKIGGLGKISSAIEEIAHRSNIHINGYFQISGEEKKKYEKSDNHEIAGPFGSTMVSHAADQVFQTKWWRLPDTQHVRRTKCRAAGLNEDWILAFDRSRWVYRDMVQPIRP